jgi:hypothetical protein
LSYEGQRIRGNEKQIRFTEQRKRRSSDSIVPSGSGGAMESAAEVIRFPSSSNCVEKRRRGKENMMIRGEGKSMRRLEGKEGG